MKFGRISKKRSRQFVSIMLVVSLVVTSMLCFADSEASHLSATARIKPIGGAYLRKSASTKSKKVKLLTKNAKITIQKEVFTSSTNSKDSNKWYYVRTSNGKKGYVRSDLVHDVKYSEIQAQSTTDGLRCRMGAGTGMKAKKSFANYDLMTIVLEAYPKGSKELWYKIKKGSKYYYVCASFVTTEIREKPSEEEILEEEISRVKRIKSINDMAIALSWTDDDSSKYSFKGGSPKPVYSAIHSEWPNRTKSVSATYGSGPMLGASCDRFVGCVVWACGADVNFPSGSGFKKTKSGTEQQGYYMSKHPELWEKISYSGDTSVLKAGDIVTYSNNKDGSGAHILIVVKINEQLAISEAALNKSYPHINYSLYKISSLKYSKYKKKAVYRLVK